MNDTNTMKISESPALIQACEFVKHFPNALVAGGVARDIILGQEFNDVDIFIQGGRDASEAAKLILDIQRQCQTMSLNLKVQETYYPSQVKYPSDHVDRIFARYPDYLRVALMQPSGNDTDFDNDLPF